MVVSYYFFFRHTRFSIVGQLAYNAKKLFFMNIIKKIFFPINDINTLWFLRRHNSRSDVIKCMEIEVNSSLALTFTKYAVLGKLHNLCFLFLKIVICQMFLYVIYITST